MHRAEAAWAELPVGDFCVTWERGRESVLWETSQPQAQPCLPHLGDAAVSKSVPYSCRMFCL